MSAALQPLADRLLLRLPEAPEKVGAIWLPPSAQDDFVLCQAELLARGDAVRDARLQPGAWLIVKRFGRLALRDNDPREFVVREADVLALVDVAAL